MRIPALIVMTTVVAIAGCGGGYSGTAAPVGPTSPQYANVAGPWQATATSTAIPGATVLVETNLTQTGGTIGASAVAIVGSCVEPNNQSTLTGTVTSNGIAVTAIFNGETVSLTGTVSGQTMTGTYTATGACTDNGTWTAQMMPAINGSYSGTITSNSAPNSPFSVTATISSNSAFTITGNAMVGGSICFSSLTLTGQQVGGAAEITAADLQGNSVTFVLVSKDAVFGTIAGTYIVTAGSCAGDTGNGTLTKAG